jgi:hypothetical protein
MHTNADITPSSGVAVSYPELQFCAGGLRRIELAPLQSEWQKELLFTIPRDHPEVQRLEGKFRTSGGLSEGMIVELVNGQQAQVLKVQPDSLVLDANHAMAGRNIAFEIELVALERP